MPDVVQRENQRAVVLEEFGGAANQRDKFFVAQRADKRALQQNRVERADNARQIFRDGVGAIGLNLKKFFLARLEVGRGVADNFKDVFRPRGNESFVGHSVAPASTNHAVHQILLRLHALHELETFLNGFTRRRAEFAGTFGVVKHLFNLAGNVIR